jgi:hypothetical protein
MQALEYHHCRPRPLTAAVPELIVRHKDPVDSPDSSASRQPTSAKADTWGVFLAVAAVSHGVAFVGSPNVVVPPRNSQQLDKVEVAAVLLCIPFVCSLFLLFCYRNRSERVIAYCSLMGSLLWLVAAASLSTQALKGP